MDQYRCRPKLSETLGTIGPYVLHGKFVWTNTPLPCFQGNSYGPMALKVGEKFPLRLVLVHGWLFPVQWHAIDDDAFWHVAFREESLLSLTTTAGQSRFASPIYSAWHKC